MSVAEVVERAAKSFANLKKLIDTIPANVISTPNTIGEWSIKDVLAHLAVWEEEAAKALRTWKIGVEADWGHISDLDAFNDTTVKARRKQSPGEIIRYLESVHTQLMEEIKALSGAEIRKRGGLPSWLFILTSVHLDEHAERIAMYKASLEAGGGLT